jgi:hypothetical protein
MTTSERGGSAPVAPKSFAERMREPLSPTTIALVREAKGKGLFYDDDVVAYVAREAGWEVTRELGTECYRAKNFLRDEEAQIKQDAYFSEGYEPLGEFGEIKDGSRYVVRFGTVYVGREVPDYGLPKEVRASVSNGRVVLLPKGSRTKGYAPSTSMLIRHA